MVWIQGMHELGTCLEAAHIGGKKKGDWGAI